MTCKPKSEEHRATQSIGNVHVWVVQRVNGHDNEGMPIVGSIVTILAYVSPTDGLAAVDKYSNPSKYFVLHRIMPIWAGITYAMR